jgi:hypothetical protein
VRTPNHRPVLKQPVGTFVVIRGVAVSTGDLLQYDLQIASRLVDPLDLSAFHRVCFSPFGSGSVTGAVS